MTDYPSSVTLALLEAAALAGWSRAHAYRLAKEGKFPGAFRVPGHRGYRVHTQVFLDALRFMGEGGQPEADPMTRRVAAHA